MKELSVSTIYDVAERAGVSIATVSRFLNTPEKLNSVTAGRVKEAMDYLAYIPHGNSGKHSQRQVGRIGVLIPFFPAPSFIQRLQGMTPVFQQAQCELVVFSVDSPARLSEYLQSIPFSRRLDGLIILAMPVSDEEARRLIGVGLETVLIEQHHALLSSVECDNVKGGALAAAHFLDKRLVPCAYVGETTGLPYGHQPSELRWQGYQQVLTQAGRAVSPHHIRLGQGSVEDGFRMGMELLSQPQPPRAVFAMSDLLAIGVLRAARTLGRAVPQEVAVLGFDDIEASGWVELSTVSQALTVSGRVAAEALLQRIHNPSLPPQNIQLNVEVVQRATT